MRGPLRFSLFSLPLLYSGLSYTGSFLPSFFGLHKNVGNGPGELPRAVGGLREVATDGEWERTV